MSEQKLTVGLLFGGRSGEHDVSLASASSVIKALRKEKYNVLPVGIDRKGRWLNPRSSLDMLLQSGHLSIEETTCPAFPEMILDKSWQPVRLDGERADLTVDVVVVMIHGTYGEDGTMQGLLEISNVPYVGCQVLASSVAMDKITSKWVYKSLGLPVCRFFPLNRCDWSIDQCAVLENIHESIPFPMFVKPSNLGSSVGISKVKNQSELIEAVNNAFRYDRRVIIEEGINAREIECSVLGNDELTVSVPAEIIPYEEFYTYTSKYTTGGADVVIPAKLEPEIQSRIQYLAARAFKAVDACGMARIDFLVEKGTNTIYISEINTIPGFTAFSAYAQMFDATGIPYPDLLDRLINLALERFAEKEKIETDFKPND